MANTRYTPFDLDEFPAGLRVFHDTVNRLLSDTGAARPWTPQVDVLETENELVLRADVPGVEMKDIDIRLENGTLTLKGERRFEPVSSGNGANTGNGNKGYHRLERPYGAFSRYFTLPDTVDPERVKADYRDGVLSVTLPKKEVAKPRTIKVEVSQ